MSNDISMSEEHRSQIDYNKKLYVKLFTENVMRKGADKLLSWILSDESDFFIAPATKNRHSSYIGGLCQHSINTYYCLRAYLSRDIVKNEYGIVYSDESIAIAALLHEICCVNSFRLVESYILNEKTGNVSKTSHYENRDDFPYGHGEKSVHIVQRFMNLTKDEALAIRWHRGFIRSSDIYTTADAFEASPLALALYIADMEAAFYIEKK